MATPDPFRAIEISRLAHRLKAEGTRVIHMEFGQPSTGAPTRRRWPRAHHVLDTDGHGLLGKQPCPPPTGWPTHYAGTLHGVDGRGLTGS